MRRCGLILFVFVCLVMFVTSDSDNKINEEITAQVQNKENPECVLQAKRKLATGFGYPFHVHHVLTRDGYILELHQIPPSQPPIISKKFKNLPVLLLHGVFQDSSAFLLSGDKFSPGFLLSSAGQNVFLYNARGTKNSRNHSWLEPEKDWKFWDFCFDELGNYDLPAVVDYILDISNEKQLYVIGFSLGGAAVSVFLAENPAYNHKVKEAYLLAPSISIRQETHEALYLFNLFGKVFFSMLENEHVLPYSQQMFRFCYNFCAAPLMFSACKTITNYAGYTDNPVDVNAVTTDLADLISGIMVKTLEHLLQMIVTDNFAKFDFGSKINMVKYGQETPPVYNIGSITTAITLFCSPNDNFVNCEDITVISKRFNHVKNLSVVPVESHSAFVGGQKAILYVYNIILQEIRETDVLVIIEVDEWQIRNLFWTLFNYIVVIIPVLFSLVFLIVFYFLNIRSRKRLIEQNGEDQMLVSSTTDFKKYNH